MELKLALKVDDLDNVATIFADILYCNPVATIFAFRDLIINGKINSNILKDLEDNIAYSTCVIAKNTNADAIVCYTNTGKSARRISGLGAGCPILAITDNKRTFRQLGLAWNVHPVYVDPKDSIDNTVEAGLEKLKTLGILESGDKVVLAGGHSYVDGVKSSKMIGGYVEI